MQVFLIPVDGSEYSKRAVDYAISRVKSSNEPVGIHILNVQAPIVTVNVKLFVSQDSLQDYYRDEGTKALAPALDTLSSNGIEASPHIGVGDPAKVICEYASEKGATEIIMGTHGRGALAGSLIGSVAQKVVHLTKLPLILVK